MEMRLAKVRKKALFPKWKKGQNANEAGKRSNVALFRLSPATFPQWKKNVSFHKSQMELAKGGVGLCSTFCQPHSAIQLTDAVRAKCPAVT
jgi:hypothetical protein